MDDQSLIDDEREVLCSKCYDALERQHFTDVVPRSSCARCGRLCLGYVVRLIEIKGKLYLQRGFGA